MSIIKLKKITVCGLLKEKDAVLAGLQQLGCMHLESLRGRPVSTDAPVSERAEDLKAALRHLEETPRKRIQVKSQENFDVDAVVRAALANKQAIRDVGDQREAASTICSPGAISDCPRVPTSMTTCCGSTSCPTRTWRPSGKAG
jgi:V/A-type H+-transporting ATPase subunit I